MRGKDLILQTLFGGASSGGGGSGGGGSAGGEEESGTTGMDALIDRTITEVNSNVEAVGRYAFYACTTLKTANLPAANTIDIYAFYGCTALTEINIPEVHTIDEYVLYGCKTMGEIVLPKVLSIARYALRDCHALVTADCHMISSIARQGFLNCFSMTALIIRRENLCTLSSTDAFSNCHHMLGTTDATYNPDGLHDGYVYVPRALIEEYPAATNWSSLALQYRALEDYTVDGTITGELDESKI